MAVLFKNVHSVLGVNPTRVDAAAEFPVGMVVKEDSGVELMYMKAGTGGATEGKVAYYDANFVATLLTTANGADRIGHPLVVAITTLLVDEYGWYMRAGEGNVDVAASCEDGVQLNTTATAGRLDDDGTAGARLIMGISLIGAATDAGIYPAHITYPTVGITDPS